MSTHKLTTVCLGDKGLFTNDDGKVLPFTQRIVPYHDEETQSLVVVDGRAFVLRAKLTPDDGVGVVDNTAYVLKGATLKALVTAPHHAFCNRSPVCIDASTAVGGADRMVQDRTFAVDLDPRHLDIGLLEGLRGISSEALDKLNHALGAPDEDLQQAARTALLACLNSIVIFVHDNEVCSDLRGETFSECMQTVGQKLEQPTAARTRLQAPDIATVAKVRRQVTEVIRGTLPVTPVHKMYLKQGCVAGFSTAYAYACEHVPRRDALHVALVVVNGH